MRTVIEGRFPTVHETANILGVSPSRVRELKKLVRSNGFAGNAAKPTGSKKRKSAKKSASRKRHAGGKTAKAGR